MFANQLKLAFRNITRQKFYSFINIFGLAIGLAICLLILLFIKDEMSYDTHHSKGDRIYRACMVWGLGQGNKTPFPITPYRLQPALKLDFPEMEQVVRIASGGNTLIVHDEKEYNENQFFIADPEIFEVFDIQLVKGDKKTALTEPNTLIISETTAQKYFGNDEPIGKLLQFDGRGEGTVTGVFKDFPTTTHFFATGIFSMKTGEQFFNNLILNNWGEGLGWTYCLLKENTNPADVEAKFAGFIEKNVGEGRSERMDIDLQKMTDIHLHSQLRGEIQANSDIRYIYISSAIALFILLLACINYMNLATARSVKRAMEIGVRKTLGAARKSLIGQFLSESVVVSVLGLIIGIILAQLALPYFNNFMDKDLAINSLSNLNIFGLFLGIAVLVGLIAGSYPAFYLSSFGASKVFHQKTNTGTSGTLRKFLVVFQFGISIILILATIVVFNQWNFLMNKDIGLNRENVVIVPIPDVAQYQSLKNQLEANPNIMSVSASNKRLTGRLSSNLGFKAEQFEPEPDARNSIKIVTTDHDFLKTLQVEFAEGRDFSREFGSDDTTAFVLNQAAVKMIGWTDSALGKWFETSEFSNGDWVTRRGNIIGIVEDYNHESLYSDVEPAVYFISKGWINWMTVRINGQNVPETLASIKENWVKYGPESQYSYQFLDDQIAQLYQTEERFFNIFTFFTMLAIFIAGLGIFGLSAFMAEQRTKEIGVRKVFGATTGNIVLLLSKEFTKLVFIGFVIAAPIAYYLVDNWLQEFVYRIDIGWLPFVLSIILALLMAWFTAGFQSLKAALANPIRALRYE